VEHVCGDVRGETTERGRERKISCTAHNVVQTPWARRTAFQGGSVDVAYDGVRDCRRRKVKRKMKKREKKAERSI